MNLATYRDNIRQALQTLAPGEVIACDYLPETATLGGVAYIISGVNGESTIAGDYTIRSVSVTAYVGKRTRAAVDELVHRLTDIPSRYTYGTVNNMLVTNVSDMQYNPASDIWYSAVISYTVYVRANNG